MAVLKKEFIDRMAETGGITKKAARQGVDLFFETLMGNTGYLSFYQGFKHSTRKN